MFRIHESNLSSLQKWSAKVQAVAPSALLPLARDSFKTGSTRTKSAGELVAEATRDPEKLLKTTRCRISRIGSVQKEDVGEEDDDGDEETFDDRDFYRSMLRDVIESKGDKEGSPNRPSTAQTFSYNPSCQLLQIYTQIRRSNERRRMWIQKLVKVGNYGKFLQLESPSSH